MLAVSCGANSGADKTNSSSASSPKPLSQRLNEKNGYKQNSTGEWVAQSNQRSSFEQQKKSPYFQGNYEKKSYQTEAYTKKSWWGNKDYGRKEYDNDKDGSRFQQQSRFDNQGAPETGTAAELPGTYQTNNYATNPARETGKSKLAKPSDKQTDTRRKAYPAPEIIDWRQQRALSLEQSKGILGR